MRNEWAFFNKFLKFANNEWSIGINGIGRLYAVLTFINAFEVHNLNSCVQCERPKCDKIEEMQLWNEERERERESVFKNNVQVADTCRLIYWNVCEWNKMQIPKTQNVRIIVQIWTKIQSICFWSHQMNVDFYIYKNWIEFLNCFLPIVYLFVQFAFKRFIIYW